MVGLREETWVWSLGWEDTLEKESEIAQSCPTLCDPMDCNLSRSSVRGIFQVRILEWVATSFSRGLSQPRDRTQGSNPGLLRCRQTLYHLSHQGSHPGEGRGNPLIFLPGKSEEPGRLGSTGLQRIWHDWMGALDNDLFILFLPSYFICNTYVSLFYIYFSIFQLFKSC